MTQRCHDPQKNDTQPNDTQYKRLICDTQHKLRGAKQHCHYAECRFFIVMLILIRLSIIMLNVVMLSVIFLRVAVPTKHASLILKNCQWKKRGDSAASFCCQVAALVPEMFSSFYLVKNHKIANKSTTTKAREKTSTDLESLQFFKNVWLNFKKHPKLK